MVVEDAVVVTAVVYAVGVAVIDPVPVTTMLSLVLRCWLELVIVGPAEDVPSVLMSKGAGAVTLLVTSSMGTLVTPSVFT